MNKITKYEQKVKSGRLEPMSGLDAVFLDDFCCELIKQGYYNKEDKETALACWDEIEYIYKDDEDTLNSLKTLMNI